VVDSRYGTLAEVREVNALHMYESAGTDPDARTMQAGKPTSP